jgi:drug/metabolite transporter (DMT)-like permease
MVTYLIPVVGLFLGAVILGEILIWQIAAGGTVTIGGIVLVNLKP